MSIEKAGAEFRVNTVDFQTQASSDVAATKDGGFVVVWDDNSQQSLGSDSDTSFTEVKARHFSSAGAADGAEFQVNANSVDEQDNPGVTGLPGGGFVVAFEDGSDATVGGTYITVRAFDEVNAPTTGDLRITRVSGDYLASNPQPVVLSDGSLLVVHGGEDTGIGQRVALPSGTAVGLFQLGGEFGQTPVDIATVLVSEGVAALAGAHFAHVYQGTRVDVDGNDELDGVIVWIRDANGTPVAGPVQANDPQAGVATAPSVTTLEDGRFVVAWTSYDAPIREGGVGDIYARLYEADGTSDGGPFLVNEVTAGSQSAVDVAALAGGGFVATWADTSGVGGDSSGSSVKARVFESTGAPGPEVLVNTTTSGPQGDPHIATLADGRFVVSWTDGGAAGGADIRAQIFELSGPLPDCPVVSGHGTVDGSPATDQTLAGPDTPNTFFFNVAATSGHDRIANFERHDVVATSAMLRDGNHDGIVTFGKNGLLDLDSPGHGSDTVAFDGLDVTKGLRFLGQGCDDVFVYAAATVRPLHATEGTLGSDRLHGDVPNAKADVFFFDTALGLSLGHDKIDTFGSEDLLVTTTRVQDANKDGEIGFGGDRMLDLPGGTGLVSISDAAGHAVTKLYYAGTIEHDGVDYYAYGLNGGHVTAGDLLFA